MASDGGRRVRRLPRRDFRGGEPSDGIIRPVIRQGIAELKDPDRRLLTRVRWRVVDVKKAVMYDASLRSDLLSLLESTTRGDPESLRLDL